MSSALPAAPQPSVPTEGRAPTTIFFAGWVDPTDPDSGPDLPPERCFQVIVSCPTPAAFDGLTLADIWDGTPVRVTRVADAPKGPSVGISEGDEP